MRIEISLCLPRDAATVSLVRGAVVNTLLLFGVDPDCADDIRLAVSEAVANVVSHAVSEDEYEVSLAVDERTCAISVKNTGAGFDAGALNGVMPSPDSARGRGVAIMKAVMDAVNLTSSPEEGTLVRLVRDIRVSDDGPLARLQRQSGPAGPQGR